MQIIVETTVEAPIEAVWRAYTTPEDIIQWNAASDDWHTTKARVDLRVGGVFSSRMEAKDGSFGFDFAGTYTNVLTHRLLEYSFGDRSARVDFTETSDGVHVKVSFDAEEENSIEQQQNGWQAILDNFKRHVEDHQRSGAEPGAQANMANAARPGLRKYTGSCHCGGIAFEVEGELDSVTTCNCSICQRKGAMMWFVTRAALDLKTPESAMATYTFNKHSIQHRFCPRCGIHPFGEAQTPEGNAMAAINVRCLDEVDLDALSVQAFDGRSI